MLSRNEKTTLKNKDVICYILQEDLKLSLSVFETKCKKSLSVVYVKQKNEQYFQLLQVFTLSNNIDKNAFTF